MSLSGLTAWQIVLQSQLCHPDWDAETHLAYLITEENVNPEHSIQPIHPDRTVLDTINRWLFENATAGRTQLQ